MNPYGVPPSVGFPMPPTPYFPGGPSTGYPQGQTFPQPPVAMPQPFSGGPAPSYPPAGPAGYPSQNGAGYGPPATISGYPTSYNPGYPPTNTTSYPPINTPSYPPSNPSSYPPTSQLPYPVQPSSGPMASGGYNSSYNPQPQVQPSYPPAYIPPAQAPSTYYPPTPTHPTNHDYYPGPTPSYGGMSGVIAGPMAAPGFMGIYPSVPAYNPTMTAAYVPQGQGTLRTAPNFNPDEDAKILRKAMKGLGTDEQTIINVLGHRSNEQRQRIKLQFKTLFGRDLMKDLTSELSFRFLQTCLALMLRPPEYDAEQLYKAIKGLGTNEETLVEILCSRSNRQIHEIKAIYKDTYKRDLERDLVGDTSGHFRRLVVSLSTAGRREDNHIDLEAARRDAMELHRAGEQRWGTDESKFNQILCSQSHAQLRAVFEEYQRVAHRTLEQSVRSEMSGDLQMGMLAIISVVRNPHAYFADRLFRSMKGVGTNDDTLIRVIVTRCEVDMVQIKHEFQRAHGQSLEAFIQGDTSGDYRKLLLALVRG